MDADKMTGQRWHHHQPNARKGKVATIQMQFMGNKLEHMMQDGATGYKNTSQLNETGLLSFELSQIDNNDFMQDQLVESNQYCTQRKTARGSSSLPGVP